MMEFNDKLVEELNFDEIDMGELFMYGKKKNGITVLKGHSSFFKVGRQFIFNQRFRVPEKYNHTTKLNFGKKRKGIVFSCSFDDLMQAPNTLRYCYEMQKEQIKCLKAYASGDY